jgi:hypothetical protein
MTAYTKNTPGAPVGSYIKGDTVTDSEGTVWECVVTGNPAQFDVQAEAAPAGGDLLGHGRSAALTGTTSETTLATIAMPALAVGDIIEVTLTVEASIAALESGTVVARAGDEVLGTDISFLTMDENAAVYFRRFQVVVVATPGDAHVHVLTTGVDGTTPANPVVSLLNISGAGIDIDAPFNLHLVGQLTDGDDVLQVTHYTVRALVA